MTSRSVARQILGSIAACLFLLGFSVQGQEPSLKSVTIDSEWRGLGPSAHLRLVTQARKGKTYLGNEVIDSKLIDALFSALSAAPVPAPQAANLGISREWLDQAAKAAPKNGTPKQQALFEESISDRTIIEQLLPSCFKYVRFDDYPSLQATVTFADGRRWVAASRSYYPFMLPWVVSLAGQDRPTFNADISRAIAAIMPIGSLNRDHLNGEELKTQLVDAVMAHIRPESDLLGVESRAPNSFAALTRNFQVESAEINPYRGVDFGYQANELGPHEENLQATLRKPSLPRNARDDVVLLFREGKIDGVENLAERIEPSEALALSVPWLNAYLTDHPEQPMYIRFVHNRSFSAKAMQNFAADMKELGKESLSNEVAAVQDKATLVFLGYGSDWIILPDKRMILWRHYEPAGYLKWHPTDFKIERCADYNANGGGCVGAVVSPAGDIQQ
jgi:hypothetical protein